MHKYGREFSASVIENRGGCVSDRVSTAVPDLMSLSNDLPCDGWVDKVMRKLVIETPSPVLVDGYLTEIAKAYGVKWTSPSAPKVTTGEVAAEVGDVCDFLSIYSQITCRVVRQLKEIFQNPFQATQQTDSAFSLRNYLTFRRQRTRTRKPAQSTAPPPHPPRRTLKMTSSP